MIDKDYEIPLSTDWLNDREKFDQYARNRTVLEKFLNLVSLSKPLTLADIGCGTGSNSLFLSEFIKGDIVWYLVEREEKLLENAKQRIKTRYPNLIDESENTFQSQNGKSKITFHFLNETVQEFLEKKVKVNAITASALFDLFTKNEFSDLIEMLAERKIPLYAVLNYCGTSIYPESEESISYISLFESHMSRSLAKGAPMGRNTMPLINEIISDKRDTFIETGDSDWNISNEETSFLFQNFNFYKEAVLDQLISNTEKQVFAKWLEDQQREIRKGNIELKVMHEDFIISHYKL